VFVDGKDKGKTKNGGLRVSNLTAKQHVVTLVKDGYHSEPDHIILTTVKGSEIAAEFKLLANTRLESEPNPREVLTRQAIYAFNKQQYVLPEGQNAVSYLKQLRELDPNFAWAKEELELSIQGAMHQADEAINQNDFYRAQEVADALVQLQPDRKEGKSLLEDLRYREKQYAAVNRPKPPASPAFVAADMDRSAAGEVNGQLRAFCGRIRSTLSKYPFQPSSQEDTSIEELTRWFAPQSGEIWKFQAQTLGKLTEKRGSRWTEKDPTSKPQVTGEVLSFLNSAQAVADAFFPGAATQPHLTFVLRPRLDPALGDSILELEIDGKSYPWTTKVQKQFTWPPPAGSQSLGATAWIKGGPLELNIASGPGIWGIFRIIGDAEPRALNGRIVEWTYSGGERGLRQPIHPAPVRMEIIEFPGGVDVFNPQFYEGLKCPARAVQ